MAVAILCGIWAVYAVIGSASLLVFYNPEADANRVQRRTKKGPRGYVTLLIPWGGLDRGDIVRWQQKYGLAPQKHEIEAKHKRGEEFAWEVDKDAEIRKRNANGHTKNETNGNMELNGTANGHTMKDFNGILESNGTAKSRAGEEDAKGQDVEYYWQSYPENLGERISWVADLLMNFRFPGWNLAIPVLPDLPPFVKRKLEDSADNKSRSNISSTTTSSTGLRSFNTRQALFWGRVPRFIAGAFLLDIFKTIMMHDPYFVFGPNSYDLPSHLSKLSPIQLRFYRLSLSAITIVTALEMAFLIMPVICGLLLGPRVFGQRVEPWYFPTYWGSFSNIANKGLNGLWGSWWHQTFRFAFAAPSNYLINSGYVKARTMQAKLLALFFAFFISALMHTSCSITQIAKTKPLDPPLFFILQAVGILIQTSIHSVFKPTIDKLPKLVRQAGNVLFTFGWLFWTAPWLVDDFARGGVWMWEPVPVSPTRALGFGVEGDTWWCWEHIGVGWYSGKHWWESGLAL